MEGNIVENRLERVSAGTRSCYYCYIDAEFAGLGVLIPCIRRLMV